MEEEIVRTLIHDPLTGKDFHTKNTQKAFSKVRKDAVPVSFLNGRTTLKGLTLEQDLKNPKTRSYTYPF